MPRILITSLFLFNFYVVCAQTNDTATLSVILENCSSTQGKVLVSVFTMPARSSIKSLLFGQKKQQKQEC